MRCAHGAQSAHAPQRCSGSSWFGRRLARAAGQADTSPCGALRYGYRRCRPPPCPTCCCLDRSEVEGRRGTAPSWLSPERGGPAPMGERRTLRERGRPISPPKSSPRFLNQSPTCNRIGTVPSQVGCVKLHERAAQQQPAAEQGGCKPKPSMSRGRRGPGGRVRAHARRGAGTACDSWRGRHPPASLHPRSRRLA